MGQQKPLTSHAVEASSVPHVSVAWRRNTDSDGAGRLDAATPVVMPARVNIKDVRRSRKKIEVLHWLIFRVVYRLRLGGRIGAVMPNVELARGIYIIELRVFLVRLGYCL